jgi:hypothetical protein
MFALCFAAPASVFAILINLRHSQVCPNCGGWGAGIGVGLAGAMLLGSLWSLAHCIRRGANVASIIFAAMSLAGAAVFLLATIGFYFAIQA